MREVSSSSRRGAAMRPMKSNRVDKRHCAGPAGLEPRGHGRRPAGALAGAHWSPPWSRPGLNKAGGALHSRRGSRTGLESLTTPAGEQRAGLENDETASTTAPAAGRVNTASLPACLPACSPPRLSWLCSLQCTPPCSSGQPPASESYGGGKETRGASQREGKGRGTTGIAEPTRSGAKQRGGKGETRLGLPSRRASERSTVQEGRAI